MLKKSVLLFCFLIGCSLMLKAQNAALPIDSNMLQNQADSLVKDSALVIVDTITPNSLRPLDSLQKAQYLDSLSNGFGFEVLNIRTLMDRYKSDEQEVQFQKGELLPKRDIWVLTFISFLLVLFAVLKNKFSKQLDAVVQSFYSNRALTNLNKEENLFTSWSFLLLFIQFGFTIGMFFYLVSGYKKLESINNGFPFFLKISVLIIILYLLKIVLLRLMGFIFNIQKPISEYVSILYLSYFNASLLFIPLVVAFALSPIKYGSFYITIGIVLLAIIFTFQFIRAGVNILSQYRFSKVYLFLYFCTLEICPILILIKAIGL